MLPFYFLFQEWDHQLKSLPCHLCTMPDSVALHSTVHANWSFSIYLLSPQESTDILITCLGEESTSPCAFRTERGNVPDNFFPFAVVPMFACFVAAFLKLPGSLNFRRWWQIKHGNTLYFRFVWSATLRHSLTLWGLTSLTSPGADSLSKFYLQISPLIVEF